jgi:hypothetical protein
VRKTICQSASLFSVVVSLSCATGQTLHAPVARTADPCAFDLVHHLIACGSTPVARVTCHQPSTPMKGACKALSIEYVTDGSLVCFKPKTRQYDWPGAYYVLIAKDGETVWFLARSRFSGRTWQSYGVFDGGLVDLPREDAWRLWLAVQERRAEWLDGTAPPDEQVWGVGQ